ncbi:hypothetical protein Taro_004999 [Colocasia esculenta]|uniref:Uncharacterized protein n=1 Tax=Colocasia esculenta TaxID=4460 RepID=A0A843TJS9_COLES|nr:hypothetical protein [Colocasia esculenta]
MCRDNDPYHDGGTRRDKVASDRADASSGVTTCTTVATLAERQTHGILHPRAAQKPQTPPRGEGSIEKLSKLTRKHEGLPILPDRGRSTMSGT